MKNKRLLYDEKGLALLELILILVTILLIIILISGSTNNIYENPKINRESEWYVNDLYMSDQYYYNNILNEEEKIIYKQFFKAIKEINRKFNYSCSSDSMRRVIDAVACDHPEMINYLMCYYNNDTVTISYLCNTEELLEKRVKKIQKEIYKISKRLDKNLTDYEKEKYIYEILAEKSDYGSHLDNSDQSAYSAFVDGKTTVCSGYAKAAQILFQTFGINSNIIRNSNHLWNLIEIDGEYYYFDAVNSSDEHLEEGVSYLGLNQNINTSNYSSEYLDFFPKAQGTKYNYYDYEGKTITYDRNNLQNLQELINKDNSKRIEVKVKNYNDFKEDILYLTEKLNVKRISYYVGNAENSKVFIIKKK